MNNTIEQMTVARLLKGVPAVGPEDTVRRAEGLIRASDGTRILVTGPGGVVGTVSESRIAAFLGEADDIDAALLAPVGPLVEHGGLFVNINSGLSDAAAVFGGSGEDMLPVIDNYGSYLGVVYRKDVLALLTKNLRPPTVAGMATPLGVYLTTGSVSGGAGNLGLFLTGVSLAVMLGLSMVFSDLLIKALSWVTGIRLEAYIASPPLTVPNLYDLPLYLSVALNIAIFLLLLRISPLSGYHAAEHMTVHAIEAGEELSPAVVRRMPRAHPRCGTNLLAAAGVFIAITTKLNSQVAVLLALFIVMLGWRSIGGWLQNVVTTKRPTDRQLENGLKAGREVMDRFMATPNYQAVGFRRMWKLGFPQTAAGMFVTLLIIELIFNIPLL